MQMREMTKWLVCVFFPGYFRYLRALLNARVPSSLEPSVTAPTPLAAAIRDLVTSPVRLSGQSSTEGETVFTASDRYQYFSYISFLLQL